MLNQKIMFGIVVAVLALAVTALTAVNYSPAHAAAGGTCKHDSTSSGDCFASKQQCIRNSPGKSGVAQC
jgi:hypothetical protein